VSGSRRAAAAKLLRPVMRQTNSKQLAKITFFIDRTPSIIKVLYREYHRIGLKSTKRSQLQCGRSF
jgi:hypothetical protein